MSISRGKNEPDIAEELVAMARLDALLFEDSDGPESRSATSIIWHIIRLARHAEQRLEFEVHRPSGWSWAGFRIMVNTLALGSVEPSQLATILGVSRPTITSNLDRLESDGLLLRQSDPSNRRKVRVILSAAGEAAVRQAMPAHMAVERQLVSGMSSKERSQLDQLLRYMLESMREDIKPE